MRITPLGAVPPAPAPANTQVGVKPEVKAKVIAMITGQDVKQQNVNHSIDPNNISVEELSAVKGQNLNKPVSNEEQVETVQEVQAQEETLQEKPKVDPALSRQFAQLARQEKALRAKAQQQEQAIKAKEMALAAREAELNGKSSFDASKYVSLEEFKANPLKVMAQTGLSYDELTQQLLNVPGTDPRTEAVISRLEAKIAALEESAELGKKSQVEQQQQTYQAAVKQITADVRNLVKMDPNFETIRATNSVSDVVELITETFNKEQILLSVEEAAQQVEDYLVEEAMKLTRIGKIKSKIGQSGQTVQSKTQTQAQKPAATPQTKTLTNAIGSTRQMTTRERAIAAAEGRLK
jgi:hypothetical protein